MKFSKLTDYAVIVLTSLHENDGVSAAASAIANDTNVPEPTVSKVLKLLSRANLVTAQRGANGGYSLARDLGAISVLDVLTAIEGPLTMTECVSDDGTGCVMEAFCALNGRWQLVNKAVEETLGDIPLTQLMPQNRFLNVKTAVKG